MSVRSWGRLTPAPRGTYTGGSGQIFDHAEELSSLFLK